VLIQYIRSLNPYLDDRCEDDDTEGSTAANDTAYERNSSVKNKNVSIDLSCCIDFQKSSLLNCERFPLHTAEGPVCIF
jgi:hypothetical protein